MPWPRSWCAQACALLCAQQVLRSAHPSHTPLSPPNRAQASRDNHRRAVGRGVRGGCGRSPRAACWRSPSPSWRSQEPSHPIPASHQWCDDQHGEAERRTRARTRARQRSAASQRRQQQAKATSAHSGHKHAPSNRNHGLTIQKRRTRAAEKEGRRDDRPALPPHTGVAPVVQQPARGGEAQTRRAAEAFRHELARWPSSYWPSSHLRNPPDR